MTLFMIIGLLHALERKFIHILVQKLYPDFLMFQFFLSLIHIIYFFNWILFFLDTQVILSMSCFSFFVKGKKLI